MAPQEIGELTFRHFVDEGTFKFASAEARATGKLYLFRLSNGAGSVGIYTGGRFIPLSEELASQLREAIAQAGQEGVPTFSTHNGQDNEQGLRQ